jgi:hypothetical protein
VAVLSSLKRSVVGLFFFVAPNSKTTSWPFLKEFFPSSPRTIFLRIPHSPTDKRFSSYGHFKRPRKGYFWPLFFCVKLKLNFLTIFEGIFEGSPKAIFFQFPHKISALRQTIFKMWPF